MGRQVFGHLQEIRVPSCVMVTCEDKCHHSKNLPPSPSSPILYTEHYVSWSGISLGSVWVTCPNCLFSTSHTPPASSPAWPYKEQKIPWLCVSSAKTKTPLYYQPCVQHKSKHGPMSATEKKTIPAETSTAQLQRSLHRRLLQELNLSVSKCFTEVSHKCFFLFSVCRLKICFPCAISLFKPKTYDDPQKHCLPVWGYFFALYKAFVFWRNADLFTEWIYTCLVFY